MIKFVFKCFVILSLVLSQLAHAGYITTDLTDDTYISYGGYDWTWASPVSTTNFSAMDPTTDEWVDNVFEDPTVHQGWMAIIDEDLKQLFAQLTLDDFMRDGEVVQSAAYWNSHFVHVDVSDFNIRVGIKGPDGYVYEEHDTFYVRKSLASVPEPTTLFIFSSAVLLMAFRKRFL